MWHLFGHVCFPICLHGVLVSHYRYRNARSLVWNDKLFHHQLYKQTEYHNSYQNENCNSFLSNISYWLSRILYDVLIVFWYNYVFCMKQLPYADEYTQ